MLANLLFVVAADVATAATAEVAANAAAVATADDDDDDGAALTLTVVLFTVVDMLTLFPLLYLIVPLLQFVFAPTPLLLLALPLLGLYFAAPILVVVVAVVAVAFAVVPVADDGTDGDDDGCGTTLFTILQKSFFVSDCPTFCMFTIHLLRRTFNTSFPNAISTLNTFS